MQKKTTNQALSRQRRWQLQQKAANRCIICGKPSSKQTREFCPVHRERSNERRRVRYQESRRLTP